MSTHFPIRVTEKVRFSDLDSFGHLNNAVYFSFFEQARVAYMKALGLLDGPRPGERSFILLETGCRFLKPCFLDETLQVEARVSRVGRTSCEMEYRLLRAGEAVAEGRGVVVYYDYVAGTKTSLPEDLREKIRRIEETGLSRE